GDQSPVELEDDGQDPWLARGAGRHYNDYLVELAQRATADWEPSSPVPPQCPAAIVPVGTDERGGLAGVCKTAPQLEDYCKEHLARLERCSLFLWTPQSAGGFALRGEGTGVG
ncbi:unnamed protein product, partial [Ectocarpus sp. 4 AP-2014]